MKDIKSMTLAELGAELKALGEPAFRAKQIYRWMHRGVRDFSEMTDISRSLRERLAAAAKEELNGVRLKSIIAGGC